MPSAGLDPPNSMMKSIFQKSAKAVREVVRRKFFACSRCSSGWADSHTFHFCADCQKEIYQEAHRRAREAVERRRRNERVLLSKLREDIKAGKPDALADAAEILVKKIDEITCSQ